MANSRWLWLNAAADRIAKHLAETAPDRFSSRRAALREAHNQLLDEAHRGGIELHGKPSDPEEKTPRFSPQDWQKLDAEYWDPRHRIRIARPSRHPNPPLILPLAC